MKIALIALSTTALLAAAPAFAQAATPADYVKMAGAGDLYEKTSSQLVLQTTANPKVRSFATMMVADHSKSTAKVKAAAMASKVKVAPPMLTPEQTRMVAELRAAKGPARDTAYIAQQKMAHDQALALQKGYAMDGTAAPLKTAAAGIVPVVEHHIAMLKTM